jgi:hypothetical protein
MLRELPGIPESVKIRNVRVGRESVEDGSDQLSIWTPTSE